MRFDKMHGLGNDFVITDSKIHLSREDVEKICARKFGVGCDTFVRYSIGNNEPLLYVDFFNSDGSSAETCGNALRCLGLLMHMRKNWTSFIAISCGKKYNVHFHSPQEISVNMGYASFSYEALGLANEDYDMLDIGAYFSSDSPKMNAACVSIGNPHVVIFSPVKNHENIGNILNNRKFFANGINVSFVKVKDRNSIELQIFERGCGFTLACGSGACASAYLAHKKGLVNNEVVVYQTGGDLKISVQEDDSIVQIGSANYVFSGELHEKN